LGISKQSVNQSRKRQKEFDLELQDLIQQADFIRSEHPGCGVEKLYMTMQPRYIGRDKFCEIFMNLGYRVRRVRNYQRTTIPLHYNYPNLIEGMIVYKPYQVIQSDITYYDINGIFYYIVFIIDVYTREILGYHVGDNMRAKCNEIALRMTLNKINKGQQENMIHHSDRGTQYGSNLYIGILKEAKIHISMGVIAQDNAYAERINGTIKNEYLKLWKINSLKDLKRLTKKAVNHYNTKRVHLGFNNKYSPLGFKGTLVNLSTKKRPKVIIYAEGNYKTKMASSHLGFNPKKEPQAHNCPIDIINEMEVNN
jgi:hypothetical protein